MSEEHEEALLFDAQIVKAVLAGNHHTAASLAAMQTYHPRPKQSDSSDPESNESSDSEMTMTTIIKNGLDSTNAGAGSIDPAGMAKSLDTESIDCSNSVARSESATNPFEGDPSKVVAVLENKTPVTMNGKEWLDFCTDYESTDYESIDYDTINPSYNSYEYHVAYYEFAYVAPSLIVEWLEPGEEFYVSEYNGYETLVRKSNFKPTPWHVA